MVVDKKLKKNKDFKDELPSGTSLMSGQYTVSRFLNFGGFGMTYLALDSLNRDVVIKECFPAALCRRNGLNVEPRTRDHAKTFQSVVDLFHQEAQRQSVLESPNIVGVHQVFSENGTVYMAMDYVQGTDLLEVSNSQNLVNAENIDYWLRKMLSAVQLVHDNGILHRDISPDNILINGQNEPILIDFGAAKEQERDKEKALTTLSLVKDYYSPQEFHVKGSPQTPSSDLYALAATFYHVITGNAPASSQSRLSELALNGVDTYEALGGQNYEGLQQILKSIDIAMNIAPAKRFQSAQEWIDYIDGGKSSAGGFKRSGANKGFPIGLAAGGAAIAATLIAGVWWMSGDSNSSEISNTESILVDEVVTAPKSAEVVAAADDIKVDAITDDAAVSKPLVDTVEAEKIKPEEPVTVVQDEIEVPEVAQVVDEAEPKIEDEEPTPPASLEIEKKWTVKLPFQSIPITQSEGTFIQVVGVSSDVESQQLDWLKSGAIIYSVNGQLTYDNNSVIEAIVKDKDLSNGDPVSTTLKVRRNQNANVSDHQLEFKTGSLIELGNDVSFFVSKDNSGVWKTTVSRVPKGTDWGLKASDVVVSEAITNVKFSNLNALERVLKQLLINGDKQAYLTILRENKLRSEVLNLNGL